MNDREYQELLQRLPDDHNPPPATPRDRMWAGIQAGRGSAPGRRRAWPWRATWAAAAVLVIGIGLGRWSRPLPEAGPVAEVAAGQTPTLPWFYQQPTLALFNQADALLTDFRQTACAPGNLPATSVWAADMLVQTRLLQGTPVGENPEMEALLLDLELVLAQILTLDPENCARDAAWISSGLTTRATLNRLRAVTDPRNEQDPL